LQIYQWVYQWKNFENRLTFGEVMGKSLVSCFFWNTVYWIRIQIPHGKRHVTCRPISTRYWCNEVTMSFVWIFSFFVYAGCCMWVSGWMFLLVLAHPGSPGQRAIKWLCVYHYVDVNLSRIPVQSSRSWYLVKLWDKTYLTVNINWLEKCRRGWNVGCLQRRRRWTSDFQCALQ